MIVLDMWYMDKSQHRFASGIYPAKYRADIHSTSVSL
jgi:hypothetical protein